MRSETMRSNATSLIALILIMFLMGCSTTPLPSPTAAPTSTPIPPLPTAALNPIAAAVSINDHQFATIQAAIDDAGTSDGDTIVISKGAHTEAGIIVHKNVTIMGQGADDTIIQAHAALADAPDRVFLIPEGSEVTIRGLTIRHGHPYDYPQSGGGLANFGDVTLAECVIADNSSNDAGGIFNQGTMAITNCTIAIIWPTGKLLLDTSVDPEEES